MPSCCYSTAVISLVLISADLAEGGTEDWRFNYSLTYINWRPTDLFVDGNLVCRWYTTWLLPCGQTVSAQVSGNPVRWPLKIKGIALSLVRRAFCVSILSGTALSCDVEVKKNVPQGKYPFVHGCKVKPLHTLSLWCSILLPLLLLDTVDLSNTDTLGPIM